MSHGMDDPAGHDQGMGGMVPPAGTGQPEAEANDMRGRAAENEQEAGTEAMHGGGHGGHGGGADDPAGDDNGVDPVV